MRRDQARSGVLEARLAAIGDVHRRAIIDTLIEAPRSVTEIASGLPITRSAVSQHLRILSDAGLVHFEAHGTRNYYRVDPSALAEVRDYLDRVWTKAMAQLKARIETNGKTIERKVRRA